MDDQRPSTADNNPEPEFNVSPPGKSKIRRRVVAISIILLCIGFLIYGVCGVLLSVKNSALREECASNLKSIAAVCITFANAHHGRLPNDMRELVESTDMSAGVYICPASNDEPASGTPQEQKARIAAGQHLSYIYVGHGLTSSLTDTTVVAFDRPDNHHGDGINVLFGDYHVAWLGKREMKKFMAVFDSGVRPVQWPPAGAK